MNTEDIHWTEEEKEIQRRLGMEILAVTSELDPNLTACILMQTLLNHAFFSLGLIPREHQELGQRVFDDLDEFLQTEIKTIKEVTGT